jgi:acyl-CoA thioesterase
VITPDAVRSCLAKDQFATHCGIELLSVAPGTARARMALQPHHLNSIGIVQGGAIFTLADFAFAAASNSYGTVAVAINVSISFIKAVATGTLIAEASENSKSSRLGTYTVQIKDEAGQLIAVFQGMVYRKNESLPLS